MAWLELLIALLPPLVLFVIGYFIRFRKAYWLISGYNTMSQVKKKNVDTLHLGILIGNMCFILGILLFFGFLFFMLELTTAGLFILASIIPVILFTLISAQKYDGNTRTSSGRMKPGAKILVGIIVFFMLIVLAFVGYMIFQDMQPISITLEQDHLNISGSYGQLIPISDIKAVRLIDSLPVIQLRTNGSAIGNMLRGHFKMAEVGAVLLYVNRNQSPYVYIETATLKFFLNTASPEQTRQLFEALRLRVEK